MNRLFRVLSVFAVIAIAAVLIVIAAAGFVVGLLWIASVLGLQHALGMDTQTSHNYAAASGTDPMIVTSLTFSGFFLAMWKHINCEYPRCPFPGHKHPDHGRPVCRRHYHHDIKPSKYETS